MSTFSPPYDNTRLAPLSSTSTTSNATAGPSTGSSLGMMWGSGGAILRMEDAVVETVVTHTTRTTTSFAPFVLPRIPQPDSISMPRHLSSELYPLANEPSPDDMRFFALNLGGRRVIVQEDGSIASQSEASGESRGPGWVRNFTGGNPHRDDAERIGLVQAFSRGKGKEVRKRPHDFTPGVSVAPTPPISAETTGVRQRSPPRKKIRGLDDLAFPDSNVLLSPLPSPEQEAPAASSPSIGSGVEVAALFSLPAIVSQFDSLPDKLQQHVLMHLFRRARMPTIQRLSAFTSTALKRDFISFLPHEIAIQILRKVDVQSLAAAARVNRKWRKIVDSERAVWRQRLIDDGMWYGLGVEEEEEATVRRRFDILDWKARQTLPKAGTPSEDEHMDVSPVLSIDDRPTPLKHVYRRRYTSDKNWLHNMPAHTSFPGHGTNVVTCLQFDSEKIVSASDDHSINIYSTTTGQLKKRLDGHEGGVWALEYKGDTLVSGSTDRTVRIWDLESLQEAHVFHGHTSTVRCLQIIEPVFDEETGEFQPPYPLIVTGSRDASLRVWKLPKKGEPAYRRHFSGSPPDSSGGINSHIVPPEENPYHKHHLEGHTQAVRALAAHGKICVSGSYDTTVRVWDIVKGTCIHTLTGHEQKVYSIVYDRYRNRCASGSMDHTVKVWDVVSGQCLHTLTGHTSLVGLLGTSPNYLVSAAADASLRIWDNNTHTLKHVLSSHAGAITCFQHDETKVVSGSDGTLKLWDIKTGAYVRDLVIGISSVWQIQFNGSLLVAASNRGGNTVFDVFDFGKGEAHISGIDDEGLEKIGRPLWESENPREPRTYQDPIDWQEMSSLNPSITHPGGIPVDAAVRAAGGRKFNVGEYSNSRRTVAGDYNGHRRSSRLADRSFDPEADYGPSQRFVHRVSSRQSSASRTSHAPGPSRARTDGGVVYYPHLVNDAASGSGSNQPMQGGNRRRSSLTIGLQDPVSPTPLGSRAYASGSGMMGMGMVGVNGESFPPIFDEERQDDEYDNFHGELVDEDDIMELEVEV